MGQEISNPTNKPSALGRRLNRSHQPNINLCVFPYCSAPDKVAFVPGRYIPSAGTVHLLDQANEPSGTAEKVGRRLAGNTAAPRHGNPLAIRQPMRPTLPACRRPSANDFCARGRSHPTPVQIVGITFKNSSKSAAISIKTIEKAAPKWYNCS